MKQMNESQRLLLTVSPGMQPCEECGKKLPDCFCEIMSQVSQAIEEQYVQNILENNIIQEEPTDINKALRGDDSIDACADDLEDVSP